VKVRAATVSVVGVAALAASVMLAGCGSGSKTTSSSTESASSSAAASTSSAESSQASESSTPTDTDTQTGQAAATDVPGDTGPAITDPAFIAYAKYECTKNSGAGSYAMYLGTWDDASSTCLAAGEAGNEVGSYRGSATFAGKPGDTIPQSYFLALLKDLVTQGFGNRNVGDFKCPDGSPTTSPSQECIIAAAKNRSS
jgi:acyl dehydratase